MLLTSMALLAFFASEQQPSKTDTVVWYAAPR